MKVPQILLGMNYELRCVYLCIDACSAVVVRAGTSQGLSFPAYALETLGYSISLAYAARSDFPFSTYGENFFLTIENVIITLLVAYYPVTPTSSVRNASNAAVVALGTIVLLATLTLVPHTTLAILQIATLPISLFSKIPQIVQNSKAKSTGQLSAVAVIAQIVGCLARLFTTAIEVGDPIVLLGFGLALILNLVIGFQMWTYWGNEVVHTVATEKRSRVTEKIDAITIKDDVPQARPFTQPATRSESPALTPQGSRKWARKVD